MKEKEQQKNDSIFSVSDYIKIVNQKLRVINLAIVGEISEVSFGPTKHVYFTLKDKKDNSILKCMIYKNRYDIYGVELKQGLKIIIKGYSSIHRFYGFSFIAEAVEYSGEGVLKKEYDKLKEKLFKEGLFEESRKRLIPKYPQKIGLITSKQGAVLADFSNNLGRFGFKIKMIDSRVEGQSAIIDLLNSIKTLKKEDIEVLVIIRGGGSLESLTAFNNELLVREVASFPVPVLVGIGHDKDIPLVTLVADDSESTPTAVANLLNRPWEDAISLIKEEKKNIISLYGNELEKANFLIIKAVDMIHKMKDLVSNKYKETKFALEASFQIFKNGIQNNKNNLESLWKNSLLRFNLFFIKTKQQLEYSEEIIYIRNPENQLNLGYSIVRSNGSLLKSVNNIKIGEDIDIQVIDGVIFSKVKNKKYA